MSTDETEAGKITVFRCREPFSFRASEFNAKPVVVEERDSAEERAHAPVREHREVEGISSSTSVDFYGTEMSRDALLNMREQMRRGIPVLPRHQSAYGGGAAEWDEVIGYTVDAIVSDASVVNPHDPMEHGYNLTTTSRLYLDVPKASELSRRLDRGEPIGQSIGGWFLEVRVVENDDGEVSRIIVDGVELDHLAITRSPANPDSRGLVNMRTRAADALHESRDCATCPPQQASAGEGDWLVRRITDLPSAWQPTSRFKDYRTLNLPILAELLVEYYKLVEPLWVRATDEVLASVQAHSMGPTVSPQGVKRIMDDVRSNIERIAIDWDLLVKPLYRRAAALGTEAAEKDTGQISLVNATKRGDAFHARAMEWLSGPQSPLATIYTRMEAEFSEASRREAKAKAERTGLDDTIVENPLLAVTVAIAAEEVFDIAAAAWAANRFRIAHYQGKLVELANKAYAEELLSAPSQAGRPGTVEWWYEWVAEGDKRTCAVCAEQGSLGFQPISTLSVEPGGDTICGGNCRCVIVMYTKEEVMGGAERLGPFSDAWKDPGSEAQRPGRRLSADDLPPATRTIVSPQSLPLADVETAWSFDSAEQNAVLGDGDDPDWGRYRKAHIYVDEESDEAKSGYKLPVAKMIDGKLTLVWRGVAAAMAALMGARGGVEIPSSEREKAYKTLSTYYGKFDKDPPPLRAVGDEEMEKRELNPTIKISYPEEGQGFPRDLQDKTNVGVYVVSNIDFDQDRGNGWCIFLDGSSEMIGDYVYSTETTIHPELQPGKHTLTVELYVGGQSLEPPVRDEVSFEVLVPDVIPDAEVENESRNEPERYSTSSPSEVTSTPDLDISCAAREDSNTGVTPSEARSGDHPPDTPLEEESMNEEDRQWFADQFNGIAERVATLEASATTPAIEPVPVPDPVEEKKDNSEVLALRETVEKMEQRIATLAARPMRRGRVELRTPSGADADNEWRTMASQVKDGDVASSLAGFVDRHAELLSDDNKASRRQLQDMLAKGIRAAIADGLINTATPTTSWQ